MLETTSKSRQQQYLANAFGALADPTRLEIIRLLLGTRDKCVSELAADLGVSVSAVSQSCRILELNQMLSRRRQGQKICYRVRLDDPFVGRIIKLLNS